MRHGGIAISSVNFIQNSILSIFLPFKLLHSSLLPTASLHLFLQRSRAVVCDFALHNTLLSLPMCLSLSRSFSCLPRLTHNSYLSFSILLFYFISSLFAKKNSIFLPLPSLTLSPFRPLSLRANPMQWPGYVCARLLGRLSLLSPLSLPPLSLPHTFLSAYCVC